MDKNTRHILKIVCPIALLVVIDLIVKFWISYNLALGQVKELIGSSFMITHVDNVGMALGLNTNINVIELGSWVLKIMFSVWFIQILRMDTLNIFKVSSALILFGWIGNLLDRLLLSGGQPAYRSMDYFYENVITHSITNISSMLSLTGWVILLISIIIRFKEFKKILLNANNKKQQHQQAMPVQ